MLARFTDRITHLRLYGEIKKDMVEKLAVSLNYNPIYNIHLIAVSINGSGSTSSFISRAAQLNPFITESIPQAKNIVNLLQEYSRKTQAPVYTFAEDAVLGAANIVFTSGNKVYANKFTLIGDFGFDLNQLELKDFVREWKLEPHFFTAGTKKVRLNPYEDLKPEDERWVKDILSEKELDLKQQILNNRTEKFSKLKLTSEKIEEDIFRHALIGGVKAKELGYIDEISSLQAVLEEKYHGVKVVEVMKGSVPQGGIHNTEL